MVHHTASRQGTGATSSLNVVRYGRTGLPGPLCNVLIGRDGSVHVITDGRANDSGTGNSPVLSRVRADLAPTGKATSPGTLNGNPYFYDIEVENNGVGEPYGEATLNSLFEVCVAFCRHHGWSANRVIHHKEWTSRKIDMSWNGDIRGNVNNLLNNSNQEAEEEMSQIVWYEGPANNSGSHAYHVHGITAAYINSMETLNLLKYLGIKEAGHPFKPLGVTWQDGMLIFDGPCRNQS